MPPLHEPESSVAGLIRCGFLGMLHLEIVQERLEREFDQTVINTGNTQTCYNCFNNFQAKRSWYTTQLDLPDPSLYRIRRGTLYTCTDHHQA